LKITIEVLAWLIALSWWSKAIPAMLYLRRVPDLLRLAKETAPPSLPSITVVVPARNEEQAIAETLRSLATQDYEWMQVIAIDDRSTDSTGALMDLAAAEWPERIRVTHLNELPQFWTGKVHAMAMAAREIATDWILFTDGDVSFAPQTIRLALAVAEREEVDHFVLLPTMEVHSAGEGAVIGYFQTFSVWAARPWKVPNLKSKRDVIGVGAFNMIRREAYEKIGGFDAIPMEILEDMRLARAVKLAGLRSQIGFGRDLARVHWAEGVSGLVGVMTKNMFAAFRFHLSLALGTCVWLALFSVAPFFGLFFAETRLQSTLVYAAMLCIYAVYAKRSGIPAWTVLLAPFAASVMIFALLRSAWFALRQNGVVWRGTFYSLKELRKRAGSL